MLYCVGEKLLWHEESGKMLEREKSMVRGATLPDGRRQENGGQQHGQRDLISKWSKSSSSDTTSFLLPLATLMWISAVRSRPSFWLMALQACPSDQLQHLGAGSAAWGRTLTSLRGRRAKASPVGVVEGDSYWKKWQCSAIVWWWMKPVWGMSIRNFITFGSNLASVTDCKRLQTPPPPRLCWSFGG